jgi:hypothetical protein
VQWGWNPVGFNTSESYGLQNALAGIGGVGVVTVSIT